MDFVWSASFKYFESCILSSSFCCEQLNDRAFTTGGLRNLTAKTVFIASFCNIQLPDWTLYSKPTCTLTYLDYQLPEFFLPRFATFFNVKTEFLAFKFYSCEFPCDIYTMMIILFRECNKVKQTVRGSLEIWLKHWLDFLIRNARSASANDICDLEELGYDHFRSVFSWNCSLHLPKLALPKGPKSIRLRLG